MSEIKAADVSKLRNMTGAGMMDCKKALVEANGDFEAATDIIRKRGQALANKRADREASQGVVLAKTNADATKGTMIVLNCETDFVAKNVDFVNFAKTILDLAIEKSPANLDELKALQINGRTIADQVNDQTGKIGEKIDLSFFDFISANQVNVYIHQGNLIATMVGLNKVVDPQVSRDVAMQAAAMYPIAIDKDDVPQKVIDKELEIGKEQARQEGKPEEMLEKIAIGKLNKFYKDSTLLNQDFVKDSKMTVKQYLQSIDKDLTVTVFKYYSLKQ
ncbi:MAG: translation elongation factor Ts [Bacteroidetes bacterium GWF2_38_335]|nr:MAG: translation elongation factor Ts [Bacteroidetes bacterium GWF2_38_335]OFY78461.1 MAG: translation elongation factor Ts [Bacteroidetes bacterium RIFOXYA12_FULL_38_20]HBS88408.1 elongation factor Ts [Bacteroidales bacterium]